MASSWILSIKVLLISAAVVSLAVTMKSAVPLMLTGLPAIWSSLVTWLKPPYLYVVINGIIITIAASTRFHHQENQSQQQVFDAPNAPPSSDLASDLPPVSNPPSFGVVELPPVTFDVNPSLTVEPPVVFESKQSDMDFETVSAPEEVRVIEDEFVTSAKGINSPPLRKKVQPEFNLPAKDKQPVTSRFANSRKPAKSSPEGARALRVLKPKKNETLESTWKMITDGRQLPLTRHLRKSDTFDNLHHERPSVVKKSETFKERTAYANQNDYPQAPATNSSAAGGGKLKKDVSLGQDELNRRVEAFIKKFNDDMRLQRQESLKQYMEMVKGGTPR